MFINSWCAWNSSDLNFKSVLIKICIYIYIRNKTRGKLAEKGELCDISKTQENIRSLGTWRNWKTFQSLVYHLIQEGFQACKNIKEKHIKIMTVVKGCFNVIANSCHEEDYKPFLCSVERMAITMDDVCCGCGPHISSPYFWCFVWILLNEHTRKY